MALNAHIVICGYSLYLDAIAETLQNAPGLLVTQLHERPGLVERLLALAPDALIVERHKVDPAWLSTLSAYLPGVPVLEVQTLQNILTFHTSWETSVSQLEHLTQMAHLVAQMRADVAQLTKLPQSCNATQMSGAEI